MPSKVLALPICFLTCFVALGQGTPPAQVEDPNAAILDDVLGKWEKAMVGIQSLYCEINRTNTDRVFQSKEKYSGRAMYVRSNLPNQASRASLELYKEGDKGPRPDVFEKYIISGTFLYEYSPANKVIRVHELPQPKAGQLGDDNLLSFLFGMKAADAKQRYQITHVPAPAGDMWYTYLKIQPKFAQDKADFTEARLVLLRSTFMPRQVWFHQPNGNEVTWDFPKLQSGVDIPLANFAQPQLPTGWQFEKMPSQAKPKVRSAGQ